MTFAQCVTAGPTAVGGKGWNMGRLAQFGLYIPAGCAVTVDAYWNFLTGNALTSTVEALGAWVSRSSLAPSRWMNTTCTSTTQGPSSWWAAG